MVKGFFNVSYLMKFYIGVFIYELLIYVVFYCRNNCCCIDIIGVFILLIYFDVEFFRLFS